MTAYLGRAATRIRGAFLPLLSDGSGGARSNAEARSHHPAGYRPEIDGLRAIAILAVMLYHAGFRAFGGGYAGVDVFFVISGYLITGIILRERAADRFRWSAFIERRVRRLVPALIVMLASVTVIAWYFLTPAMLKDYSASLKPSALFIANFHFWRLPAADYFSPAAHLAPLLHLWSLGVEEQFYLLYPPFLLVLTALPARWLRPTLILAAMAGLALCALWMRRDPDGAFFLLPPRGWEFLVGAIVAATERNGHTPGSPAMRRLLALAGALLIVVPLAMLEPDSGFPWPGAVPVVAGTALVIAFANPREGVGRILASRPMVGIGLISYGAYLWHQPLLALARQISPYTPSTAALLALLALALVIAAISRHCVELPFQRRDGIGRWPLYALVAAAILAFMLAGRIGWRSNGAPGRLTAHELSLATIGKAEFTASRRCMVDFRGWTPPTYPCIAGTRGPITVAVFGDSIASALFPAIADAASQRPARVIAYVQAGCPIITDPAALAPDQTACGTTMAQSLAAILANPQIDTVVVANRWQRRLTQLPFDNGEGGVENGDYAPKVVLPVERVGSAIRQVIGTLLASGKRVILFYPVPEAGWDVPSFSYRWSRLGLTDRDPSVSAVRFHQRSDAATAMLDALADHPNLLRIRPEAALCGTFVPERCAMAAHDGQPLYIDAVHPGPAGARIIIAPALQWLGKAREAQKIDGQATALPNAARPSAIQTRQITGSSQVSFR